MKLGLRFNAKKPRPGLTSPWAQEGLAKVSEYGCRKYTAWNWAKGLSWGETIDSLERHLIAFKKGEKLDPESGLPHIDHIQWNAMALSHFEKLGHGVDDRWKKHERRAVPRATRTASRHAHQPLSPAHQRALKKARLGLRS